MIFFLVIPFLMLGCLAFFVSAAIPPFRRFALGTALWFATCGPILIGTLIAVFLCFVGLDKANELFHGNANSGIWGLTGQMTGAGWLIPAICILAMTVGATVITLLHGVVLRRMTLALFRVYLTLVSFGVGILSIALILICVSIGLGSKGISIPGIVPIVGWLLNPLFAAGLAYACFTHATSFRGAYPEQFQIVTKEEFHQA